MSVFLKKHIRHIGMALVLASAILLLLSFFVVSQASNLLLIAALLLVICGVVLYVHSHKSESKY